MAGARRDGEVRRRSGRAAAGALALGVSLALVAGCGAGPRASARKPSATSSSTSSSDTRLTASASPLEALPAAVPAALQPYYHQKLRWKACDDGFQCATVRVPMDYDHPGAAGGGDIALGVVRKQAFGSHRLGSLLVNPGGPGGSAVDYAEFAGMSYPLPVRKAYDIVGVDPRGVGRSRPVSCLSDSRMDAYTEVDQDPRTPAGIDALIRADREFAQGCAQHSGKLLGHVSTVESARDMDVVRAALGQPRLDYLGKSYGTFLGATYAGLYPSRVGKMVLDGSMDPAIDTRTSNEQQAGGFQTAFASFARDCAKRPGCPVGKDPAKAGQQLDALFAALAKHPAPAMGGRSLDQPLAMTGVLAAMYDQTEWPQLRTALAQAQRGKGAPLLALSDQYYERDPKGHYSNLMYANMAVNCLDQPSAATTAAQVEHQLPAFEKASPQFGASLAWAGLSCAYWPVKATGAAHTVPAEGAPPIIVVGTTRDPATPYAWAQSLAGQLSSGRLLTYDGDGHTAYSRGSTCIDNAIDAYLLAGTEPRAGLVCH
ncbi:alpha/beta hydrolase [Phaeacidiphilus oryzae]|uniref:alpha/beta hydrolase n=1 Tax=Phaeacidiphilus oryzae TaxID=348818 RepID=UPI00389B33EA